MKLYKFYDEANDKFNFKIYGHKVQDGYREFEGVTAFGSLVECIEWIKSGSSSAAFRLTNYEGIIYNIYNPIYEIEFEKLEDLIELVPEEIL